MPKLEAEDLTPELSARFLKSIEEPGIRLEDRFAYLNSNVGDLGKLISYMSRFPAEAPAHLADMVCALGEVMVQAEMLALDLQEVASRFGIEGARFDPANVKIVGLRHTKERYQDFLARWRETNESR